MNFSLYGPAQSLVHVHVCVFALMENLRWPTSQIIFIIVPCWIMYIIKTEILLCKAKTYFASKLYMNGTGNYMVLYNVFIFHVD